MQCGETISIFQKECNKIIEKLDKADCEKFKTIESDEERIRFIFDFAKTIPIVLKDGGKNIEDGQCKKVEGNGFFAKKQYESALAAYNDGIIKCPQNDGRYLEITDACLYVRPGNLFLQGREKNY